MEEIKKNIPNKENWFLRALIGEKAKRDKAIETIRNLPNEFKNPRKAIALIIIGAVCYSITFFGIQGLRSIQNQALYCTMFDIQNNNMYKQGVKEMVYADGNFIVNKSIREFIINTGELKPMPEGEHTYKWFLDYYKDGRKAPWQGFNCNLDVSRWFNERFKK